MTKMQEMGLSLATADLKADRWYKRVLRINSRCLICGKALRHADRPVVFMAWDLSRPYGSVATVCIEHGKPRVKALEIYLHGPCFEADHGRRYEGP